MTTRYRKFLFQLQDRPLGADQAGPSIITTGGLCVVTGAGTPLRSTLYDKDGASLANPITISAGRGEFYTLDTVESVDLFIQTGDGQSVQLYDVEADALHLVPVDRGNPLQTMVIPFHITNFATTVETDTGLDQTLTMAMLPNPIVQVTTLDAGDTIDVGTDGTGGNDPDGFVDGVALDTAVCVKATRTNGSDTMGALLSVQDSANAGDLVPEPYINSVAENITITMTGTTGAGYVFLSYLNMARNQPKIA